tara:strand:- start:1827 stop:2441 length:615 start_codon:yes stop_codon:yes gene_type:complete
MSTIIAPLAYTGSIGMWAFMTTAETLLIEQNDYYQKQTLRNRTYIHGANGKLLLSIPIRHLGKTGHQYYNEVEIENSFEWQKQHWKSIQSAYRSSPYFEFYEYDISIFYKNKFSLLYVFNKAYFKLLLKLLGWNPEVHYTESYKNLTNAKDIRSQIEKKEVNNKLKLKYTQVFEGKNGFIPNLSILDLLFNEGPNTLSLLKTVV